MKRMDVNQVKNSMVEIEMASRRLELKCESPLVRLALAQFYNRGRPPGKGGLVWVC